MSPGPWWLCAFSHKGKGYVIRFKLLRHQPRAGGVQFLTPMPPGEEPGALFDAALAAAERFARDNAEFIAQAMAA